jgi:hypothetical protein
MGCVGGGGARARAGHSSGWAPRGEGHVEPTSLARYVASTPRPHNTPASAQPARPPPQKKGTPSGATAAAHIHRSRVGT